METLSHLPTDAQTDLAYNRIDALLRAYGFSHAVTRSQYCLEILEEAIVASTHEKEQALETVAARIALNRIRSGVTAVSNAAGLTEQPVSVEDLYLALQAAKIPQNAADIILANSPIDEPRLTAIRAHYQSQAKPSLRRTSMGAPSLRFDAIDEVTDSTERYLQRHPALLKALKLSIVSVTLYIVYIFAR
ncbi:hypothetical protein SH580_05610 [Coraliomargarita algicola]|uniref:Uncharacterized protein n=1 Tax=Coraliomargarita algicola TaxID=3092156 RepID=A0ABZ0RLU4_9BACT|nr:hypothetical protein [Coraliomargarita sp. J2-16]WPJ97184.1 hypothetical protein SH580_05610 [Coraliomargarita sp. J2-16]